MNYDTIRDEQEKSSALKYIPELTYDIFFEGMYFEGFDEATKDLTKDSSDEDLAEGFITFLEFSSIGLGMLDEKRQCTWWVVYDYENDINWKMKENILESFIMTMYSARIVDRYYAKMIGLNK